MNKIGTRTRRDSTRPPRPHPPRSRGYLMIELLIALTITGLMAVAVSSMLFAVSNGMQQQGERRKVQTKQALVQHRVNTAVRQSKMVLAETAGVIVVWVADTNENDAPNLSELQRIEWDNTDDELLSYEAPDSLSPGADTEYVLTDDFVAITAALAGSANFPEALWATGVTDWTVRFDSANVQEARLVSYDLTVVDDAVSESAMSVATLRTD